MRDHDPLVIEEFNGFFDRGEEESAPPDHFADCENVQFSYGTVKTRDGIDVISAIGHVLRMYAYNSPLEGLLILDVNNDLYHVIPTISATLILHVDGMTDFGFVEINGRAFINPSASNSPAGLSGEFMYVYEGDMTPARKAAGFPPVDADGALAAAASGTTGNVEAGLHIYAVVYETKSGFLTAPGPDTLPTLVSDGTKKVDLSNIPVSPSAAVVARRVVATKAINPGTYNGNTQGYQFFFVPDGRIADNTSTTLTVNFYDSELIDDASHLFDNFSEIPAGGGLGTYHNRLLSWDEFDNLALVRVSYPGEPEAISQVDGFLLLPDNGLGITTCQEYRDILYVFKVNSTNSFTDNGDVPTSWPQVLIDGGLGCGKHGVCRVNENVGPDIEYINILNYSGIYVFNGLFVKPELSWKINTFWCGDNGAIGVTQATIATLCEFYNDPLSKRIYITIPDQNMILMGDYGNGLDAKAIKWTKWVFDIEPTTISLFEKTNTLLIGDQNT